MRPHIPEVVVGRIAGVYGIKGWVKILSYTRPIENILVYTPWSIRDADGVRTLLITEGKCHGKGIIAHFAAYGDRDQVKQLVGAEILIPRDQLPETEKDEYYWSDLIGLKVTNLQGIELGIVDQLLETGANDVLIVQGDQERLIPFVRDDVVINVDLDKKTIQVDWDPDF